MKTALIVIGAVVLATGIPFLLPQRWFGPRRHAAHDPDDPGIAFVIAVLGVVVGLLAAVGGVLALGELPSSDNPFLGESAREERRYATLAIVVGGIVALLSAGWLLTERLRPRQEDRAAAAGRVPCPYCAEPIQAAAVVCRYCGRDVQEEAGRVHASERPG